MNQSKLNFKIFSKGIVRNTAIINRQHISTRSNTRGTNRLTVKIDTQCEFINNSLGIM
jgi:hypothetical protein